MSNKKKTEEVVETIEEVEIELNDEVIAKYSKKLEAAINRVATKSEEDTQPELLAVLVNYACSVAFNMGMDLDQLKEFCQTVYESLEFDEEEEIAQNTEVTDKKLLN